MPGIMPGIEPAIMPGIEPGAMPGIEPGSIPGMEPGIIPGTLAIALAVWAASRIGWLAICSAPGTGIPPGCPP